MKKITSMFMAVAMILALTVPALASTSSAYITGSGVTSSALDGHLSSFVGEYQDTVLDIEMPNNVVLVFNPYRLQYDASSAHASDSAAFMVDKLADQIFSAPVTIVSKSNIQLDVDMAFVVTKGAGSEIILAEEEAAYDEAVDETTGGPGQNVLLQLQYGIVTEANAEPSDAGSNMKTITLPETTGKTLAELQETDNEKDASDASKQGKLTARIPASNGTDADAKYFSYKFTGKAQTTTEAAGEPKNPYDDQDTIDVQIAFTFVPVANDANQIQGGEFYYTFTAGSGGNDATATARTGNSDGTNSAPITVSLIQPLTTSSARTTASATYPAGLKYTSNSTTTEGATVSADGKQLTLATELLLTKADLTKTTNKHVVVVPVDFKVVEGTTTEHIVCNVRIIMCPIAAAAAASNP